MSMTTQDNRPPTPGPRVNINGKEYDLNSLSPEAKQLITQISIADQEMNRQQAVLAMIHAARQTWGTQLEALLTAPK